MTTLNAIAWESNQLEHTGIPHIDGLVDFVNRLGYEPNDPDTFDYLDEHIKKDGLAFVRQGIALARICRYNLFRFKKFKSFRDYCQLSIQKSVSYCTRLIDAASLVLRLINLGFTRLPQNESQCRPLVKIADDCDLEEKWQLILDTSDTPSHKGIVTAQLVADVMGVDTHVKKSVRLSNGTYEKLKRLSAKSGKSLDQLIDEAIDEYIERKEEPATPEPDVTDASVEIAAVDPVPATQKFANWQADLAALVEEFDGIRGMPAVNSS
jgi:hypothetical protein